jgi:uncharacterized protein (DUF952 family)
MPSTVYKICERALWEEWQRSCVLHGAEIDLRDGFIHLSSAAQVRETAGQHFAGMGDLVLIALSASALDDKLKWEISRGGDLFPHFYGALPLAAVIWAKPLPLNRDRRHVFPETPA